MDKLILKSDYVEAFYNPEEDIIKTVFLPATEDMWDAQWRNQMLELVKVMEEYQPGHVIDDNTHRMYPYPPDMQAWMVDHFANLWNKTGLKKYVQVIPRAIAGKLTAMQIEELAENHYKLNFEIKMVEDMESAIRWIKEEN